MKTKPDDSPAAILATAVVPWTARLEFDEPVFRRLVEAIASRLTRHIYVFGTAGEGYAVSDRQFDEIATAFGRIAADCGAQPMLGVISMSLPTIIERISRGRELGFRRFQFSLPSWGELNDREVDVFFAETCGRFPDCEFLHYNLRRARRLLTGGDYLRLAAAHPNLVAVKASASDPTVVADLLQAAPRLRFFLTEFGYALARQTRDDVGLLISLASFQPELARRFVHGSAEDRQTLLPDLQAMGRGFADIARDRFHIDGAFDKQLARGFVPDFPLHLLPPYASASEEDFARWVAGLPAPWRPKS